MAVLFIRADYRPARRVTKAGSSLQVQASRFKPRHSCVQCLEPGQEPLLGLVRGPWREVIRPGCRGQTGVAAEQAFRFALRKARKLGRLEIGRTSVRILDLPGYRIGQYRRQPEADVNGGKQPLFDGLVVAAEQ